MESLGKEKISTQHCASGHAVYGNKRSTDQHAMPTLRMGFEFSSPFIEVPKIGTRRAVRVEDGITSGDATRARFAGREAAASTSPLVMPSSTSNARRADLCALR